MIGETDSINLTSLLFWVTFFFCLALTAGGILLIFRFKRLKGIAAFSFLQYYTILTYTFGFYVLWVVLFLSYLPLSQEFKTFARLVILLGTPFLLAASVLQLLTVVHLVELKARKLLIPAVLVADLIIIWMFSQGSADQLLEKPAGVYGLAGALAAFAAALVLFVFSSPLFSAGPRRLLAGIFVSLGLLYLAMVIYTPAGIFATLSLVFIYFLLNTALCIVFVYQLIPAVEPGREMNSFTQFVKKYSITNRESEIIQEMYKGKSNQQIADTLFVTLQTVKDHSSRIYQKTDVKSRAQLVALVRDFGGS